MVFHTNHKSEVVSLKQGLSHYTATSLNTTKFPTANEILLDQLRTYLPNDCKNRLFCNPVNLNEGQGCYNLYQAVEFSGVCFHSNHKSDGVSLKQGLPH